MAAKAPGAGPVRRKSVHVVGDSTYIHYGPELERLLDSYGFCSSGKSTALHCESTALHCAREPAPNFADTLGCVSQVRSATLATWTARTLTARAVVTRGLF